MSALRFGECKGDSDTVRARWAPAHVGVSSRSTPSFSLAWWLWRGYEFGSSLAVVAAVPDFWSLRRCESFDAGIRIRGVAPPSVKDFVST